MSRRTATCDTSVLVPALASWHARHQDCRELLRAEVRAVPAHVLLEAYSVLTRLPAPHRLRPADVAAALGGLGRPVVTLSPEEIPGLVASLAAAGLSGGAVYDGLVAATAHSHGLELLTADRRARSTYDVVGARYRVI